jgi:hypothetical protein
LGSFFDVNQKLPEATEIIVDLREVVENDPAPTPLFISAGASKVWNETEPDTIDLEK